MITMSTIFLSCTVFHSFQVTSSAVLLFFPSKQLGWVGRNAPLSSFYWAGYGAQGSSCLSKLIQLINGRTRTRIQGLTLGPVVLSLLHRISWGWVTETQSRKWVRPRTTNNSVAVWPCWEDQPWMRRRKPASWALKWIELGIQKWEFK